VDIELNDKYLLAVHSQAQIKRGAFIRYSGFHAISNDLGLLEHLPSGPARSNEFHSLNQSSMARPLN
jgi:hypothetical protein